MVFKTIAIDHSAISPYHYYILKELAIAPLMIIGEPGAARTRDKLLKRQLLYRLSYGPLNQPLNYTRKRLIFQG
jgi:hypothetical protein